MKQRKKIETFAELAKMIEGGDVHCVYNEYGHSLGNLLYSLADFKNGYQYIEIEVTEKIELINGEWYTFKVLNEYKKGYYHEGVGKFRNELDRTSFRVDHCTNIKPCKRQEEYIPPKSKKIEEIDIEDYCGISKEVADKLNEVIQAINDMRGE